MEDERKSWENEKKQLNNDIKLKTEQFESSKIELEDSLKIEFVDKIENIRRELKAKIDKIQTTKNQEENKLKAEIGEKQAEIAGLNRCRVH